MELVSTFSVWKTDMNIWMTDNGSGGFIFFLILIYNYRIITLQYFDGFCYTSTWIGFNMAIFDLISQKL